MTTLVRNLQNDDESLHTYLRCEEVEYAEVRRRLLLLERGRDRNIPDHHYRLQLQQDLHDINNLSGLLSEGVARISDSCLHIPGKKIFVRDNKITEWQSLLPSATPLLLTAGTIWRRFATTPLDQLFEEYIVPNSKFTSLHNPNIGDLQNIKFGDLHVHLNGMTETDIVWQDSLKHPSKIYDYLRKTALDPLVQEQYEQEGRAINDYQFYDLLYIARKIRWILFWLVFDETHESVHGRTTKYLLSQLRYNSTGSQPSGGHPFSKVVTKSYRLLNDMPFECLMYIVVMNKLHQHSSSRLAALFHFYLLILGLNNRMLVQQLHQYGFDQFQKHTLNKMREYSEELYEQRFLQAAGNDLSSLSSIEGRFAPKSSERELDIMLSKIREGYIKANNQYTTPFELTLVAHFIKQRESNPADPFIRHKKLRIDSLNKAIVLEKYIPKLLRTYPLNQKTNLKIVGIDAASNELHSPPEVFAPVFRKLRLAGSANRMTFHVGEDFFHILSGLRAIFEAIDFLDLAEHDRIGHGVAAGLCPDRWFEAIGPRMLIRKGEWFDNLVFVRSLSSSVTTLDAEILEIGVELYGYPYSIRDYLEAWQMRKYCPLHYFGFSLPVLEPLEVAFCKKIPHSVNAKQLFKLYHSEAVRNRYDEIIEIDTFGSVDTIETKKIQTIIMDQLASKKITIEALPTSNVRIGHYEDMESYHLWNWKASSAKGSMPDIVIGSDDPGIFATNIYNEYAHLYHHLENYDPPAMPYIQKLIDNAKKHRF